MKEYKIIPKIGNAEVLVLVLGIVLFVYFE
jgi:hypothetical protein